MSLTVLYNIEYSAYARTSGMVLINFSFCAKEFANENRDF